MHLALATMAERHCRRSLRSIAASAWFFIYRSAAACIYTCTVHACMHVYARRPHWHHIEKTTPNIMRIAYLPDALFCSAEYICSIEHQLLWLCMVRAYTVRRTKLQYIQTSIENGACVKNCNVEEEINERKIRGNSSRSIYGIHL